MRIALIKTYSAKPWRSPATYQRIEDSLAQRWPVSSINTRVPEKLWRWLTQLLRENDENVLTFNIGEYLDEDLREGFLPALLEASGIPHLGSPSEAVRLGLDKARTKEALASHGIPSPPAFIAEADGPRLRASAEDIGYPLFVKPLREGGHIGIDADSIVHSTADLDRAVRRIWRDHAQPALVERFITGPHMREFSVGVIDGAPRLFAPVEIDFDAMGDGPRILSYQAAQAGRERIKPIADDPTRAQVIDLAGRTFDAVGAHDYARVDLRMDAARCYVLEINVMPGLGPHSFLPEAARMLHGLEYAALIQHLAESAGKRWFGPNVGAA